MDATLTSTQRTVTCERCGAAFGCGLGDDCWCATESFRLPLPVKGADCLCPDCLRALVRQQGALPS
jgi:hypothetical protein